MIHQRVFQRDMFRAIGIADSMSPPRAWWDYVAGLWFASTLKQIASDVPAARAMFMPFVRRDFEFEAEVKPTLVDATQRFAGGFAREFAGLTHYFAGAYYTSTTARLRIYKQYAGLPKVSEGLLLPTLDSGFADSLILDSFADMNVRGLSPRYTVTITYHDDTSDSVTVPLQATSITFTVKKPIKRIDVFDVAGRLQGFEHTAKRWS
jgi:hypothetical protein